MEVLLLFTVLIGMSLLILLCGRDGSRRPRKRRQKSRRKRSAKKNSPTLTQRIFRAIPFIRLAGQDKRKQQPAPPTAAELRRKRRIEAVGRAGERELLRILSEGLDPAQYTILPNIMLPNRRGVTTEVDFIVVSKFGVFVIESKNFMGFIETDPEARFWTHTIPGKVTKQFKNPIHQNNAHLFSLEEATGIPLGVMYSVTAFSDRAKFTTPMPDGVCYFSGIVDAIHARQTPQIKAEQIPDIVAAIREWDQSIPQELRDAHVENLRRRHG